MAKSRSNRGGLPSSERGTLKPKCLTTDELLLQPWFLSQRVQQAIRSLVPPSYRRKMRDFFDDYGCMICASDERYGSNGMCFRCYHNVRTMLHGSARRRLKATLARRIDLDLFRRTRLAKRLLGRFSPKSRASSQRRRNDTAQSGNPVDEMLGPRGG